MTAPLPTYGITDQNNDKVIDPDSAMELDVGADTDLNTHPVEQGGFQSFNRVQQPASVRLLLACQGINMPRPQFLSALKALKEGTQLVTLSLPDDSYQNMALKGYGYKRTAERGAVTIWADTTWVEERSTNVTVSTPATVQPQGAGTSNIGSLTSGLPSGQQQASIANPPVAPASLPPAYSLTAPPSGYAF